MNEDKLKQKIVMRYFRFVPLVLIACFIAYLLLAFKLCPLDEFYNITGNTWGLARLEESYTFMDMLKIGLFTSFFEGTQLVSPLWCFHYIFCGSMLSFVMMLLYSKIDNKIFFFGSAVLLFYFVDQNYLAFIIGLIAGIIANKEYSLSKTKGAVLIVVGCIFGLFPSVLLPSFINVLTLYALGSGFVIIGIHCSFSNNRLLCNKFTEFLGKESLALILWQMLVLQSLNIFLYNRFYTADMSEPINITINFVINVGVSLLLTLVSSKTITPFTNCICNKVSMLLWKQTQ
jgi:peptidoglycan/LPS O-acetylase OafA/YrhL